MLKLTVLYGHPEDEDHFEKHYAEIHIPLVGTIKGLEKAETTKFVGTIDGSKPEYYRMAELYFKDQETLGTAMSTAEGQATANDLANFASGGATIMIGAVD